MKQIECSTGHDENVNFFIEQDNSTKKYVLEPGWATWNAPNGQALWACKKCVADGAMTLRPVESLPTIDARPVQAEGGDL